MEPQTIDTHNGSTSFSDQAQSPIVVNGTAHRNNVLHYKLLTQIFARTVNIHEKPPDVLEGETGVAMGDIPLFGWMMIEHRKPLFYRNSLRINEKENTKYALLIRRYASEVRAIQSMIELPDFYRLTSMQSSASNRIATRERVRRDVKSFTSAYVFVHTKARIRASFVGTTNHILYRAKTVEVHYYIRVKISASAKIINDFRSRFVSTTKSPPEVSILEFSTNLNPNFTSWMLRNQIKVLLPEQHTKKLSDSLVDTLPLKVVARKPQISILKGSWAWKVSIQPQIYNNHVRVRYYMSREAVLLHEQRSSAVKYYECAIFHG